MEKQVVLVPFEAWSSDARRKDASSAVRHMQPRTQIIGSRTFSVALRTFWRTVSDDRLSAYGRNVAV